MKASEYAHQASHDEGPDMTRPWWLHPPYIGFGPQIQVASGHRNDTLVENAARLYWPDPGTVEVLDATYGKGNFWTQRMLEAYNPHRNDIDPRKGDTHHDFRYLPQEWGDRFGVSLFDPDYTVKGTRTGHSFEEMNEAFGLINTSRRVADMLEANQAGLAEVARVTAPGGIVCVKFADQIDSGSHVDGIYQMQKFADMKLGLVPLRRMFLIRSKAVAQPRRTKKGKPGWSRQRNAAQNTSELMIYKVPT